MDGIADRHDHRRRTPAAPRRWWHDTRWLTAIVVTVVTTVVLAGLFGPETRIVVSRETTFITTPLRADGTPDYDASVLARGFLATPPEDNAAVGILHATWPMGLDATQLSALCGALGVPDEPPGIEPITNAEADAVFVEDFSRLVMPMAEDFVAPPTLDDDARNRMSHVVGDAQTLPWRSDECPPLAAWVARQGPALDSIVAAAARPRLELPPPDLLSAPSGEMLLCLDMPELHVIRDMTRAVSTRAMLHVGEGRTSDAWRDIHAIHRLSRLLVPSDRERFLITYLVSIALGSTANEATLELLDSPLLTEADVRTVRRDLEALPRRAAFAKSLVIERLAALDMVVRLAHVNASDRDEYGLAPSGRRWLAYVALDFNAILRTVNGWYDRIDAALADPLLPSRREAIKRVIQDADASAIRPEGWDGATSLIRDCTSRVARSERVADLLVALTAPPAAACRTAEDRAAIQFDLLRIAAALADYRVRGRERQAGEYPATLEALVPEFLSEVPLDRCSGTPFVYERRGQGYLLYSVGENGVDDGGTNEAILAGEWRPADDDFFEPLSGDLVVRMPRPKRRLRMSDPPALGDSPVSDPP